MSGVEGSLCLPAALAAGLTLSACAVGPNFFSPEAPEAERITEAPLPAETESADTTGGAAQKFIQGADVPGRWWTLYKSGELDTLVDEALRANPDLEAQQAALRQAQQNYYAAQGALFPQVDANASVFRQRLGTAQFGSGSASASLFTLYNASVSVSYLLDVFGGTRRAVESAGAAAEAEEFRLQASYLTVTSNVVTGAIQEASLRAQIAATRDIIRALRQELGVLNQQYELGAISRADVLSQQSLLAQTEATLPALEQQLAQTRNQLAALIGRVPSKGNIAAFDLGKLHLPTDIPVSLPSKLVEQRPDVRAAEAALHQASAEVGVATANLLPQITLSASYGGQALSTADLFSAPAVTWSLGASIVQAIFHGGTLWYRRGAAKAAYERAFAQYKSTVLAAFADVANALRALQSDAEALKANVLAEKSARERLFLTQEQFRAGAVPYLSVLDAQRTWQQARIVLVQAQAARYADTAALYVALGGGWWNTPAPTGEPTS
ncbi:MAG: efflux transporter outer membrane subunit [Alphaproteobacteria bacterium]